VEERVKRSVYVPLAAMSRRGRNNAKADEIDGRMGSDIKGRHEKQRERGAREKATRSSMLQVDHE